ncbi:MAG TPA: hypothetical protein PLK24_02775 [Atribacter sp.]|jgi:hypothetical protein|uniref:Uncharacterized protein n=1 Tax=Candidatus Atribacter allofermentans TaxID=1852833 RepID=A0A1V5SYQ5_9BACT|nr:hypothetical protein [Atribacter sp.]MDD3714120.1 hypothetical protein [Atribacterota bacterium]OQA59670.1 MAG: hypothetical protein BWY41_00824 [Candidatus Atribacteria bacterium ADurb.Bin276]HHT09226.1 hypothetical protein [Candidatus Atribacteria bacterium]MDI9595522.1 hypothetical protein [Atribacterota bacterium]HOT04833.1 hypothetical protein [Atribacter sp.]
MRTILSILGVIFLIILAFRFFPVIIAGVLVVIGAILLILLLTGVAIIAAPILILLLLIGVVVWVLRLIF